MSKVEYTQEELEEFKAICDCLDSYDQVDRVSSRLDMSKFIEKHGKAKCDEMFKVIS